MGCGDASCALVVDGSQSVVNLALVSEICESQKLFPLRSSVVSAVGGCLCLTVHMHAMGTRPAISVTVDYNQNDKRKRDVGGFP